MIITLQKSQWTGLACHRNKNPALRKDKNSITGAMATCQNSQNGYSSEKTQTLQN